MAARRRDESEKGQFEGGGEKSRVGEENVDERTLMLN